MVARCFQLWGAGTAVVFSSFWLIDFRDFVCVVSFLLLSLLFVVSNMVNDVDLMNFAIPDDTFFFFLTSLVSLLVMGDPVDGGDGEEEGIFTLVSVTLLVWLSFSNTL